VGIGFENANLVRGERSDSGEAARNRSVDGRSGGRKRRRGGGVRRTAVCSTARFEGDVGTVLENSCGV
jgi:hypothetical protein